MTSSAIRERRTWTGRSCSRRSARRATTTASRPALPACARSPSSSRGFGGRANAWAAAPRLLERHVARRPSRRAPSLLPRRRSGEPRQRPALAEGRPAGPRSPRPAPPDLPGRAAGRRQGPRGRPRPRADAVPGRDVPPGDGLVLDQRPPPVRAARASSRRTSTGVPSTSRPCTRPRSSGTRPRAGSPSRPSAAS